MLLTISLSLYSAIFTYDFLSRKDADFRPLPTHGFWVKNIDFIFTQNFVEKNNKKIIKIFLTIFLY